MSEASGSPLTPYQPLFSVGFDAPEASSPVLRFISCTLEAVNCPSRFQLISLEGHDTAWFSLSSASNARAFWPVSISPGSGMKHDPSEGSGQQP
jgi:hypothetical protein